MNVCSSELCNNLLNLASYKHSVCYWLVRCFNHTALFFFVSVQFISITASHGLFNTSQHVTSVKSHCWTVTFRLCDLRLCRPQLQRIYAMWWSHDVFSYLAVHSLIGADLTACDSVKKISFFSVWKCSVPDGASPVVFPWFWRQLDTVSSLLP